MKGDAVVVVLISGVSGRSRHEEQIVAVDHAFISKQKSKQCLQSLFWRFLRQIMPTIYSKSANIIGPSFPFRYDVIFVPYKPFFTPQAK